MLVKMIDDKKLKVWVEAIQDAGPDRVVIDLSGEATTPRRAREDHSIHSDIIYIRDDGWSLGTPAMFDTVAQASWQDAWIAVMYKDTPSGTWQWKRWPSDS